MVFIIITAQALLPLLTTEDIKTFSLAVAIVHNVTCQRNDLLKAFLDDSSCQHFLVAIVSIFASHVANNIPALAAFYKLSQIEGPNRDILDEAHEWIMLLLCSLFTTQATFMSVLFKAINTVFSSQSSPIVQIFVQRGKLLQSMHDDDDHDDHDDHDVDADVDQNVKLDLKNVDRTLCTRTTCLFLQSFVVGLLESCIQDCNTRNSPSAKHPDSGSFSVGQVIMLEQWFSSSSVTNCIYLVKWMTKLSCNFFKHSHPHIHLTIPPLFNDESSFDSNYETDHFSPSSNGVSEHDAVDPRSVAALFAYDSSSLSSLPSSSSLSSTTTSTSSIRSNTIIGENTNTNTCTNSETDVTFTSIADASSTNENGFISDFYNNISSTTPSVEATVAVTSELSTTSMASLNSARTPASVQFSHYSVLVLLQPCIRLLALMFSTDAENTNSSNEAILVFDALIQIAEASYRCGLLATLMDLLQCSDSLDCNTEASTGIDPGEIISTSESANQSFLSNSDESKSSNISQSSNASSEELKANNGGRAGSHSDQRIFNQMLKDGAGNVLRTIINRSPFSFKADVMRLVSNILIGGSDRSRAGLTTQQVRRHMIMHTCLQSEFGSAGAVEQAMNHCRFDDHNPLLREWSIFALKNLAFEHKGNQSRIESLRLRGDVVNSNLREAGMKSWEVDNSHGGNQKTTFS
jgi:hypothetical protein